MRLWIMIVVPGLIGTISGLAIAHTEFAGVVEYFEPASRTPTAVVPGTTKPNGPKAIVDGGTIFQFDSIAHGASADHKFVVRNEGDETLTLNFDHPSCGMCIAVDDEYKSISIPPGESADVVVKYSAKKGNETLDEAAYFRTNDPLLGFLRFDIKGVVTQAFKMIPTELTMGSLSVSEGATTTVKLLGYRSDKMVLKQTTFSDPSTENYYELTTEPMTLQEVVAEDKHATCGLAVKVHIKPGLPLGTLNQMISFQCHADQDHQTDLRVSGEVVGDLSILGNREYVAAQDALMLGVNKAGAGRVSTFHVLVKGPYRDQVQLSVAEVEPADVLQVTIGDAERIGGGRAVKFPVRVELSKDAPKMSRLGNAQGDAGRVVIDTTHPVASKIALQVKFAVE